MKCWIAVASAEHVRFGRSAGFMQVCHGRGAPLRRIAPGDCVAYYSPTATFRGAAFRGADPLKAFTAIGIVKEGAPYQADMGNGFRPFRRDVRWLDAEEAPIRPLLERLAFARGNRNWGYRLRLGLFEIGADDMAVIADAMRATLPERAAAHDANSFLSRSTAKSTKARTRAPAWRPPTWTTWMGSGGSS